MAIQSANNLLISEKFRPLLLSFASISVVGIIVCFFLCLFHGYTCRKCRLAEAKEKKRRALVPGKLSVQLLPPVDSINADNDKAPDIERHIPYASNFVEFISSHPPRPIPEVTEQHIKLSEQREIIGEGHFGIVIKTTFKGSSSSLTVAVKSPKPESSQNLPLLQPEADIMARIPLHVNILQLIAILNDDKNLRHLVLEYCRWGSLESILPKIIIGDDGASSFVPKIVNDKHILCVEHLNVLAYQITNGMAHLAKTFCHRDLALRNFLVTEHYLVKIADFGLAKQAIGVYIVSHPCPTPREIAPEALREGIFTERSDVYSFGLSLAFLYNLSVDVEVIERARNLQSIAKPILADNELFKMIQLCLSVTRKRPKFSDLSKFFHQRVPSHFLASLKELTERNNYNLKKVNDLQKSIAD